MLFRSYQVCSAVTLAFSGAGSADGQKIAGRVIGRHECGSLREFLIRIPGDVLTAVRTLGDRLGHIQIAAHPDRGEPDAGDLDYTYLLPAIMESGYEGFVGAEYRPRGDLEAGLTWMNRWRQTREMS